MPMVRVSNGGTLPDTLTFKAQEAFNGGQAAVIVPKSIADYYNYFTLTKGTGYLYIDGITEIIIGLNVKCAIADYPFSNNITTYSINVSGSIAAITLSKE